MSNTPSFQTGDIVLVTLRSGGPRMTVSGTEAGMITVQWFEGTKFAVCSFPARETAARFRTEGFDKKLNYPRSINVDCLV
jgi:uncharacterized protein YodC (DUF2158 family)